MLDDAKENYVLCEEEYNSYVVACYDDLKTWNYELPPVLLVATWTDQKQTITVDDLKEKEWSH